MSETLHIVRKDVRRLRWILAIWIVVLAGRVAVTASAASVADRAVDTVQFFGELNGALGMAELLLMALIVARLVHEEPPVGFNAFWLTRPYSPGALVLAKLLTTAAVLVVLPFVSDIATMVLFGARAPALVTAGSAAISSYFASVLALMVIAVLTPSLGAFVLTIVAMIAGTPILLTLVASLATFRADEESGYTPPAIPDATPGLVMLAVFLCAALAVVVYQYRHRHRSRALALVLAGLAAAAVILPAFWPWPFALAETAQPGPWAAQASAIHDASWGTDVVDAVRFRRVRPPKQVNARVMLSGMPGEVTIQSVGIRARLQLEDGTVIESSQKGGFVPRDRTPAIRAALGGATLLVESSGVREAWSPMITLTEDEFARHRSRAGRLDATIDFHLARTQVSGVLPLTPGAALDRGVSRIEILGVERRIDSRAALVRQWRARSPLDVELGANREYVLLHRGRGEALPAGVENSFPVGGRANAAMMILSLPLRVMGYGFSAGSAGGSGFSASTSSLRFPGFGYGKAVAVDPSWYDEAEFVVLETAPAGTVTKSLTIENFVIPVQ